MLVFRLISCNGHFLLYFGESGALGWDGRSPSYPMRSDSDFTVRVRVSVVSDILEFSMSFLIVTQSQSQLGGSIANLASLRQIFLHVIIPFLVAIFFMTSF